MCLRRHALVVSVRAGAERSRRNGSLTGSPKPQQPSLGRRSGGWSSSRAIVRNEDRTAYLEAVNRGQTKHDLTAFYEIIEAAVERSLDAYLAAATGKQSCRSYLV